MCLFPGGGVVCVGAGGAQCGCTHAGSVSMCMHGCCERSHGEMSVALGACMAGCVAVPVCACAKGLSTNLCSTPHPDSRRTKCNR